MHLAGMAGTGKSRVINALMYFFLERKEAHRFIVLAPTGSAAALLNGSTYHSILGIHGSTLRTSDKALSDICKKLDGVDYIFLDEVSMLSCRDLYKISAQLSKAFKTYDKPFGGLNFIFAGDFAQLPPVGASSLYSGYVGTQVRSGMTLKGQEEAIGKALWHQVTTVVILRQNMRMSQQTEADSKL